MVKGGEDAFLHFSGEEDKNLSMVPSKRLQLVFN